MHPCNLNDNLIFVQRSAAWGGSEINFEAALFLLALILGLNGRQRILGRSRRSGRGHAFVQAVGKPFVAQISGSALKLADEPVIIHIFRSQHHIFGAEARAVFLLYLLFFLLFGGILRCCWRRFGCRLGYFVKIFMEEREIGLVSGAGKRYNNLCV